MPVAASRPLIKPGIYEAISTSVRRKRMRARGYVQIHFTIFKGAFTDGDVLAVDVPAFYNVPDEGIGPGSRLARLYQIFDRSRRPGLRASDLENKVWKVEVVTITIDSMERPLPRENQYSKVNEVLERLA